MIRDFYDKSFFINLNSRKDRLAEVQKELMCFDIDATRIPGINGNPDNIKTKLLPGEVGCALSHLECFKRAEGNEIILILEDDVEFRVGANALFDKWVVNVPDDWDILFLGGNHWGYDLSLRKHPKLHHVGGNVYKTDHTITNHAYFIRGKVITWMIERIPRMELPVDMLQAEAQLLFNAYTFVPNLAWQRKGFSSIQNKKCDYSFMKDKL